MWLARVSNHGIVDIYTAFRHMWGDHTSGFPVAGSYLRRDESDLVCLVLRMKAELHMLANVRAAETEPHVFYTRRWGLSLSIDCASWGAIMPYGVFERIETFYLHLSRIITAEKVTRAFVCMPMVSLIASSPNPVS